MLPRFSPAPPFWAGLLFSGCPFRVKAVAITHRNRWRVDIGRQGTGRQSRQRGDKKKSADSECHGEPSLVITNAIRATRARQSVADATQSCPVSVLKRGAVKCRAIGIFGSRRGNSIAFFAPAPWAIQSSNGNARATPVPLRNVRRSRCQDFCMGMGLMGFH